MPQGSSGDWTSDSNGTSTAPPTKRGQTLLQGFVELWDPLRFLQFNSSCLYGLTNYMEQRSWRQHGPPKRRYSTTTRHGVTTQKTVTWIFTKLSILSLMWKSSLQHLALTHDTNFTFLMSAAPPPPLLVFMLWRLVKHRQNFTLPICLCCFFLVLLLLFILVL